MLRSDMSCNIFCAQCSRKNPKETSVSNSFCGCCNETLCPECSKNHTAIKGFSNHELILSDTFASQNFTSLHQCNVNPKSIPTWYCVKYNIFLCDECDEKARHDRASCNKHVCFHMNPSYFVLANIKIHVQSELEKMEYTLDICCSSRVANEEVLNTSETSLENDDDNRTVFDECLDQLKSERKGIKMLQQYLQCCKEEFKLHFRSNNSRTLSFLMRMANLKHTIVTLYSSLNKIILQPKDGIVCGRLERNISPICETKQSIIKSFQIECVLSLPEDDVIKIILIESHVVVFTELGIQRYNCRNELENKIAISFSDSAYITKYRLVAILVDNFVIKFLNMDSFKLEEKQLNLQHYLSKPIKIIHANSEYVYFAGHNDDGHANAGRVNFNRHVVDCVSIIGEVGNIMHISNEEIFIPFGHCVKIYSLQFQYLRNLTLYGEVLVQRTEFKGQQQQLCNNQGILNNQNSSFSNISPNGCKFISITTDNDNNVYAAMDSHDIMRWNCRKKEWDCVITGCHGVRKPSLLCFDNEFANLYVCSNELRRGTKWLLKYKVNLDIVDI